MNAALHAVAPALTSGLLLGLKAYAGSQRVTPTQELVLRNSWPMRVLAIANLFVLPLISRQWAPLGWAAVVAIVAVELWVVLAALVIVSLRVRIKADTIEVSHLFKSRSLRLQDLWAIREDAWGHEYVLHDRHGAQLHLSRYLVGISDLKGILHSQLRQNDSGKSVCYSIVPAVNLIGNDRKHRK